MDAFSAQQQKCGDGAKTYGAQELIWNQCKVKCAKINRKTEIFPFQIRSQKVVTKETQQLPSEERTSETEVCARNSAKIVKKVWAEVEICVLRES